MGGSESSHGGRKVSFGLDEREQVRVLQGIRLTEDVVNRMKESQRDSQRSPHLPSGTAQFSTAAEGKPKSPTGIQPPTASNSGQKATVAEQELYRRYEQEQALVQEELLRLAKREREAAGEVLSTALQRERSSTNEERKRAAQLAVELQGREAELKRQEAFYKEQLARIERKNAEIYKLTSEQYQEAATKAEEWIKRRNIDPVCASLQSEILKCYQENQREVLKCSELAKEYQRCVSAAQKALPCVVAALFLQGVPEEHLRNHSLLPKNACYTRSRTKHTSSPVSWLMESRAAGCSAVFLWLALEGFCKCGSF
ncbi:MICOS complex subunit MIC25 isoform X2 [Centrocercus urophasianus]|uniref:MICOS complex subunit MIC25 isoform X2 n=1 Tax=Centrocercus urophasianus TaxID=9002 RepID=UPI001C654548|nr:MICOS complex subunit MIC25 isoform X2 [Centrocercus urophasianus]